MYRVQIVSGEISVADGSFLSSNVSWDSRREAVEAVQRSTVKYMEELKAELAPMPGYKDYENKKSERIFKKLDRSRVWLYPSGL